MNRLMPTGETLLKFTDYPFAYSIVGIISGIIGFSLGQNQIIFLGIAGAAGTFLTIVDPLGVLFRKNAERRIKNKMKKLNGMDLQFKLSSLKSKSIVFELEKIIGMFYFVIIIILFLFAIILSTTFFEKLVILDSNKIPLCSEWCFKFSYLGLGLAALGIMSEKGRRFWKDFDNKTDIAAYHMTVINDDNATQSSVESLTRAVEQNDWELADLWSEKIADEIQYKKGKREVIIKAADTVFSPLHKEANDFENKQKNIPITKRYPSFDHMEWDKIKQFSRQSIIDDSDLHHRIDSFYNMMYDFNNQLGKTNREILNIINKHASDAFGRQVSAVRYDVDGDGGTGDVDLIGCVLFRTHPLDFHGTGGKARHIEVVSKANVNRTDVAEEYAKFDSVWNKIVDDAQQNNEVQTLQHWYSLLKTENSKLMKVYSDKIRMQWNV